MRRRMCRGSYRASGVLGSKAQGFENGVVKGRAHLANFDVFDAWDSRDS